jgi:hypothetical protein
LDRWQQHADQNANDGDHDQQFNQRKAISPAIPGWLLIKFHGDKAKKRG